MIAQEGRGIVARDESGRRQGPALGQHPVVVEHLVPGAVEGDASLVHGAAQLGEDCAHPPPVLLEPVAPARDEVAHRAIAVDPVLEAAVDDVFIGLGHGPPGADVGLTGSLGHQLGLHVRVVCDRFQQGGPVRVAGAKIVGQAPGLGAGAMQGAGSFVAFPRGPGAIGLGPGGQIGTERQEGSSLGAIGRMLPSLLARLTGLGFQQACGGAALARGKLLGGQVDGANGAIGRVEASLAHLGLEVGLGGSGSQGIRLADPSIAQETLGLGLDPGALGGVGTLVGPGSPGLGHQAQLLLTLVVRVALLGLVMVRVGTGRRSGRLLGDERGEGRGAS